MVLHDIPDDAELIKVAAAALSAEGLLEDNLDIGYVLVVPTGGDEAVGKAHDQHVLHQLLAQVVVYPVELLLREQPVVGSTYFR